MQSWLIDPSVVELEVQTPKLSEQTQFLLSRLACLRHFKIITDTDNWIVNYFFYKNYTIYLCSHNRFAIQYMPTFLLTICDRQFLVLFDLQMMNQKYKIENIPLDMLLKLMHQRLKISINYSYKQKIRFQWECREIFRKTKSTKSPSNRHRECTLNGKKYSA